MSDRTEIYICAPGQSVKKGKMDFAPNVMDRHEAEQDARERCKGNPAIGKIVYYAVGDDDQFRTIFSYDNPEAGPAPKAKPSRAAERGPARSAPRRTPRAAKKPPGLLSRLVNLVTVEAKD